MSDDYEIEAMIEEKGLNAPRITSDSIDQLIVGETYHCFKDTTVTVCCLTLANGYNAIGDSACVSRENFDEEIGKQIAYRNAREKIWALEGYLLRQKLSESE